MGKPPISSYSVREDCNTFWFAGSESPTRLLHHIDRFMQLRCTYSTWTNLDESGAHASARHFVLAGVSVYETNVDWATRELNRLQSEFFPEADDNVLFRSSPLRAREGESVAPPLGDLDMDDRRRLLEKLYDVAFRLRGTFFAVVIEKSYLSVDDDPYERALEQMLSRFDRFINRINHNSNAHNRGVIVIADSHYRARLEVLAQELRREGTQWGDIRNIVDIPVFTPSKNARLLQIADLISNTVYGRYESGHAAMFDKMLPKFDQADTGRMHGLLHITGGRALCYLPCCLSRRLSASY